MSETCPFHIVSRIPTREIPAGWDLVGAGGEATVWQLGPGLVAKLYHKEKLARGAWRSCRNKVHFLIKFGERARRVDFLREVVWPEFEIRGVDGWFHGYGMPAVTGVPLHEVFRNSAWSLRDRLSAALQLAKCVQGLHSCGCAVGDLSSSNVLLGRATDQGVLLRVIDSDSFHMPGFPCLVETPRYCLPEVHREEEPHKAGAKADEHALAFLCFELLLGGVSPFAHKGCGTPEENAAKQFFALGENQALAPVGPLLLRWQALPKAIQEYFLRAFIKGKQRPSAREWASLFSSISVPEHWPDMQPATVVTATTTRAVPQPGRTTIDKLLQLVRWKGVGA